MSMERTRESFTIAPSAPVGSGWLLRAMERITRGQVTVVLPDGQRHTFTGTGTGSCGEIHIARPLRLLLRVLMRGAVGFAEGYMGGDWHTPRLAETLHLFALNEPTLRRVSRGRYLTRLLDRARHHLNRNSRRGSRRNIGYHYDLGNDFYRLWLDETMTYSAAIFGHPDEPLAVAQRRKYRRMLDLVQARPGDHILEVGCGWGGFAVEAARRGVRVTGITLSKEQLTDARRRVADEGLGDRVDLRLMDYRELDERFDHIVSIEMFEAVGEAYWRCYFEMLRRCLRPGGKAALQVITIHADRFDHYRRNTDFIQKYIFPGGMLPSPARFRAGASAAGLAIVEEAFFGEDYARTLSRWQERLQAALHETRARGYSEAFIRMWRYYLAYCEAGFKAGRIDVMQVALQGNGG